MNLNKLIKVKDGADEERDMVMFGLFNDGGNIYSSRSDENWYWATSDGETAAEFKKRLKRQAIKKAERNYNEYFGEGASYGVKVFKDIRKFLEEAEKVGLRPNVDEYKYLLEEPKGKQETEDKEAGQENYGIVFDKNILKDKRAKFIWDSTEAKGSWEELAKVLEDYKHYDKCVDNIEKILIRDTPEEDFKSAGIGADVLTLQAIMYVLDNLDDDFGHILDHWETKNKKDAPEWLWELADMLVPSYYEGKGKYKMTVNRLDRIPDIGRRGMWKN